MVLACERSLAALDTFADRFHKPLGSRPKEASDVVVYVIEIFKGGAGFFVVLSQIGQDQVPVRLWPSESNARR